MSVSAPATQRLVISGRVQGVGFRDWMVAQAAALGISGWVRNRQDGTVEATVHGDPAAIEELVRRAQRGPHLAAVDSVIRLPGDTPPGSDFLRLPTA
jgi:acylphosphatase